MTCKFEMNNCQFEDDPETCMMCSDSSYGITGYLPIKGEYLHLRFDLFAPGR